MKLVYTVSYGRRGEVRYWLQLQEGHVFWTQSHPEATRFPSKQRARDWSRQYPELPGLVIQTEVEK